MADTETGVMDSTANDSQDLAFINEGLDDEEVKPSESKEEGSDEDVIKGEEEEPEKEEKEDEKDEKDEEQEDKSAERPPVHDRPSMQQLREAFPDLFKKFPSLRDIYYREQEFTQIFPTIEDAKEASSYASSFQALTDKVVSGDGESLFNAIKATDAKSFNKIAENVLPTLFKISPDVHWRATLPLMQNLVRGFYAEGRRRGNENISNAAEYLSDFVFGDVRVARGERDMLPRQTKQESEELRELASERNKFIIDKVDDFTRTIRTKADDSVRRSIVAGDKHDPDGVFSDFIKDTIVGKVMQEVDRQLTADKSHMRYMNSLWEKAKRDGFSEEWKSRILSAYLARAKSLVPTVRAKYVSEAMGSSSKASGKTKGILEKNGSRREPGTSGRDSKVSSNGQLDAKKIDWNKTSDMDLLEDRVTFRK